MGFNTRNAPIYLVQLREITRSNETYNIHSHVINSSRSNTFVYVETIAN